MPPHRFGRRTASLMGIGSIGASDYFQTADPGGESGVSTGFWVAVIWSIATQAVGSATRVIADRFLAAPSGWTMYLSGALATHNFACVSGAAATVNSPTATITAANVGKYNMSFGVHDGTAVRLYLNRSEVGAGTVITGYAAASTRMCIGSRIGVAPASGVVIYGVATGRGVLTLAQIQSAYDATKLALDMSVTPGVTNKWTTKHSRGSVPASVENLGPGTDTMAKVGTGLTYVTNTMAWGW